MRLPISPAKNTKNMGATLPSTPARTVTVLHHVSDVIQSNLKWRINPNSAAKIQTFFDICKYKNKIYQNSQKLILRPLFLFRNFS